jgi:hypothetical protein
VSGKTPFKRAQSGEKLYGIQLKLHHITRELRGLWNLPRGVEKTPRDQL